jgi:5-formyltetrahydrofolate cyclo-ligase
MSMSANGFTAHRATAAVIQRPEYQSATRLSVFLSIEGKEISTSTIVRDALSRGKEVFVPYIHKAQRGGQGTGPVMDMLALKTFEEYLSLKTDKWGIPSLPHDSIADRANAFGGKGVSGELIRGEHEMRYNALGLIVVPAVTFDRRFGRLGHGRGYYDTFFSRCSSQTLPDSSRRMPILSQSHLPAIRCLPSLSSHADNACSRSRT